MRPRLLFSLPLLALATLAGAQENLGMYYQNLYFSTHVRFGGGGYGGRRRTAKRVAYVTRFNPTTSRSGAIERMVARVPASSRAAVRARLTALQGKFPQVMRAASRQLGTPLRADDLRDVGTLAGVGAFQELRGKTLTNKQFQDELKGTYRNYAAASGGTRAQAQENGETYEMAILLMGLLEQDAKRPGNAGAARSAGWLRGLAMQTFRKAYNSGDVAAFEPTAKGLVRIHK